MKKLIILLLFLSCNKSIKKLINKNKIGEIYWQYILEDKDKELKKYLENKKIDVNKEKNEDGEIALTLATKLNKKNIINMLLEKEDINVNARNEQGQTALMIAILESPRTIYRTLIIENLLKRGADLNLRYGVYKHNILMLAILKEDVNSIKKIISENIDINYQNSLGETALVLAVESNIDHNKRVEIINCLLKHNSINVNIQDINGYTALNHCILKEAKESVFLTILSSSTHDLNLQDNQGKTLVMHAIEKNSSSLIYLLLKEEKINLGIKDINNKSLIEYLLDNFNENIFNLFKNRPSIEKLKFIDHLWLDFIEKMLNDLKKGDLDSFYKSFISSFKNEDKNKATSFLDFLLKLSFENKENIYILSNFLGFLDIFIEENLDYYLENFKESFSEKITKKIFEAFNNQNEVWTNFFFYRLKDLKNNKLMFDYFVLNSKKQNLITAASLNGFHQIFSQNMKILENKSENLEIEARKLLYRRNIEEYNNFLKTHFEELEIETKRSFHLIHLIKENYDDAALKLMDCNPNLKHRDEKGLSAIHYATIYGKIEVFNEILSKDINQANFRDKEGNSPLIHLIGSDFCEKEIRIQILNILLENPKVILNINSVNDKGYNALLIACLKGDYEIVEKLIDKNINLNVKYQNNKHLIDNLIYLLNSSEREFKPIKEPKHLEIIKLILKKGIKLEKKSIKAIAKDNYLSKAIMKLLKNSGFNFLLEEIEIFNLEDLHFHIKEGNIEKVESYILSDPGELNSYSEEGKTALHYAILFPNILKRVLSIPGININAHNGNGNTPLVEILKNYNHWLLQESVDMLLERKDIDVNIIMDNNSTPLIFALKQCKWRTAEKLLKNENIKLYLKDIDGRTAFDIAVLYLEFEIAQKILEKDRKNLVASPKDYASLDSIQSFLIRSSIHKSKYPIYFESLIFAAERGCNQLIVLSLEKKLIDSDFLDKYMDKLFSLAIERCDLELVEILLNSIEDINRL